MNEIKNYGYLDNLDLSEYIAFPIYVIIILLISLYIQNKNIRKNPIYKYYTLGVSAKLAGAVIFCLVYIFVYKGGDTISYFENARALTNLLLHKPSSFFTVISEPASPENFLLFDGRITGYPWAYMYYDPKTFLVSKLLVPFMLISFQSYMLTTILLSWVSFAGIWRLYIVFTNYYRQYYKQLAFTILFVPSAVFWGSGILKDTITLTAACWYVYSFYRFFIVKENRVKSLIVLVISAYVILTIKSYIFIALLPGSIVWLLYERIQRIRNRTLRISVIPVGFLLSILIGLLIMTSVGDVDLDKLLNDASVKQNDLKRAEYNGNSFDIGSYEPTFSGALLVSPAALLAGLYRPFVWEARNVVMIFSGLENFLYLLITIMIFARLKFKSVFKIIFENPLIIFSFSYSIIFALIVGLSTSNFGALVRFKIAFLPVFVSALVVLYYLQRDQRRKKTPSNNRIRI
jgi:hypothetical protein